MDVSQGPIYTLAVPQELPRFHRHAQRLEDERKLAKILLETGEAMPEPEAGVIASGRDLRGIPAIGRGSASCIPGTQPLQALLAKERRRR